MKKSLIALTAILGVVFITANAFAFRHGNGPRQGCGQGNPAFSSLTETQKTQLSELRQKFIDETYETRAAMMDKHRALQMLLETSNPERSKIDALSNDLMTLKREMHDKRIDYVLEAKKIAPELNMAAFDRPRGGPGNGNFRGAAWGGGQGRQPCIQ